MSLQWAGSSACSLPPQADQLHSTPACLPVELFQVVVVDHVLKMSQTRNSGTAFDLSKAYRPSTAGALTALSGDLEEVN